jgi:hypothetical protein
MSRCRILSLDGGGAWALIQVKALIDLYSAGGRDGTKVTGQEVLHDFDLIAANSGGSIVLGGLVEDMTLGGLLDIFLNESVRRQIFAPTTKPLDRVLSLCGLPAPRYSAAAKYDAIRQQLPVTGAMTLAHAAAQVQVRTGNAIRLLIISFGYDRHRAVFFRSHASGGAALGTGAIAAGVTLADAIHASTNAPVLYFDAPATFPHVRGRLWDGGVTGCNNPVLAAVTEACGLGYRPADVIALSIGTATVVQAPDDRPKPHSPGGLLADITTLAGAILDDPPDMASFIAHVMTGGGVGLPQDAQSRIIRISPLIGPVSAGGAWRPPGTMGWDALQVLGNIGMDAVKPQDVSAIESFTDLWIAGEAWNQPVRADGDTLAVEVGQRTYPEAKKAWQALINSDGPQTQTPTS